ncbi:hypothetical protein M2C28_25135, partial [Klebsiella pneumoniae]|nr:hypothetical protein [Klebsiella pneumoniae]
RITPSVAEQEGQQTETEATGAPQKHHYTLNQQVGSITTHVHAWLPDLLALIEQGLLTPEEIVTHHMPLEEAARGYQIFEKREEACRKVILVPGMQPGKATL